MQVLIACLLSLFSIHGSGPPTVTIKNGTYFGIYDLSFDQDRFFGIPYAQPPSGINRLKKPISLNVTWSEARPATHFGYHCPQ